MKKRFFAVAAFILACAGAAVATNYSLWINGRNNANAQAGNYADFTYWGPASTAGGVNKISVNWDGSSRVADQNYRVRDALDCYCTGSNWCYIAAHSAGNLQIGYALSLYGGTSRTKRNAVVSGGQCGVAAGGGTQTGWNIKWVNVAAGAGGTRLCNPTVSSCNDLTTGTAANEGGSVKWTNHDVKFRDSSDKYNHYTNGNWGGVVGLVRANMVTNAL